MPSLLFHSVIPALQAEGWWPKFRKLVTKTQQVREQLEETLDKLMAQVAQRASKLKSLHTQVSGQAEANPMTQRLIQRHPKIERLVPKFNQLTKSLPEPSTIESISTASVVPPSQVRSCDEMEAEQDALWAVEFLRIQSSIGLMAKNLDDRNTWSEGKLVWGAIDHRFRLLRATEEVGLAIWEADRLWRWTTARVTAFIDFISGFRCTKEVPHHANEFAWEAVLLLDNWLEARVRFSGLTNELLPRMSLAFLHSFAYSN